MSTGLLQKLIRCYKGGGRSGGRSGSIEEVLGMGGGSWVQRFGWWGVVYGASGFG